MENIETLLAAVAQTQGFDDDPVVASATSVTVEKSDSRPGNSAGVPIGEVPGNAQPSPPIAEISAAGQVIGAGVKRKRGRPPKGQHAAKPPPPKREKLEDEEEDVCFICFDGGSLVLCDRKGCPKAYHPACIKRDEEFFNSKAKWNCGWHICIACMKPSHYMCYTCTYSLCKGCARNTDYVCVRGNKGFCSTCMKTIMLIENKGQANTESVQVDFDDKTSWEYLFKVYWVILKEKLSLTLGELTRAKPPWKGVPSAACKPELCSVTHASVDAKVSISSLKIEPLELNKPCVEISFLQHDGLRAASSGIDNCVAKLNCNDVEGGPNCNNNTTKPNMGKVTEERGIKEDDKPIITEDKDKQCIYKSTDCKEFNRLVTGGTTEWASRDLLEFVVFMRNGDMSPLSPCEVQTLLLDYINGNSLWASRQKRQIICDQRLRNLFGKPRVGNLEMLKLLEFHFRMKGDSQNNSLTPAGFVSSDLEADGNRNSFPTLFDSRKRKTQERNDERAAEDNLNEYAAIDVHNINLIYLRRSLMENLLEDPENFNNKVIGSVVRIRASTNHQKLDIYRLVQVVGTIKVAEPYKIGERTANVMLEVLNLDEKEVVSIDAISNQEFTEDECRWFRKSIRCGLIKHLTVGELQKIAMALQPVRINDLLEAEILRQNYLRDQAIKNGDKKGLRECLDRLKMLKSPEERQCRIAEVPEIHSDPKMSPNYESEEENTRGGDNSRKDECAKPSYLGFPQNGKNSVPSNKRRGKEDQPIHSQKRMTRKMAADSTNDSCKPMNQVNIANSEVVGKNDRSIQRTELEISTMTACAENSLSANSIETEKLWHYRDPNGKIQGPFSMMELRIWNTTGLFLPDMRIWTNHEQYDSLLLTDALIGHLHGGSDSSCKRSSGAWEKQTSGGIGESEGRSGGKCTSTSLENQISGGVGERKRTSAGKRSSGSPANQNSGRVGKRGGTSSGKRSSRSRESRTSGGVGVSDGAAVGKCSSRSVENRTSGGVGESEGASTGKHPSGSLENHTSGGVGESEGTSSGKHSSGSPENRTSGGIGESEGKSSGKPSSRSLENQASRGIGESDGKSAGEHSSGPLENRTFGGNDEAEGTNRTSGHSKQTEAAGRNHASVLPENNSGLVKENASDSPAWPQCWDLLNDKNSSADDVEACNSLPLSSCGQTNVAQPRRCQGSDEYNHGSQIREKNSNEPALDQMNGGNELQTQSNNKDRPTRSSEENLRSQKIDLSSNLVESESVVAPVSNSLDLNKQIGNMDLSDLQSPTPTSTENQPSVAGVLELMSPAPKSNNEDVTETKPSGILNFPVVDSGPSWTGASALVADGTQIPDVANEWCEYSSTPIKPPVQEWDSSMKPEEMNEYVPPLIADGDQISEAPPPQPASNMPSWLAMLDEPIEFDALGEESVSDLLAEVDAMESQGAIYSPNSALKFAREFLEECKDDCFSSIEDFNPTPEAQACDASGSTGEMQMTSQSSCNPIETFDAFDSFRKSSANSSATSEGGTNAQAYSGDAGSEFHPPAPNNPSQDMVGHATTATSSGSDPVDPGWGNVQGNINLVTVQGNVNLVLGGPTQGMANLGWGTNPGTTWVNPSINQSPRNGSLPWDGQQRKYAGERYTSPRSSYQGNEPGFSRGRPPRGRGTYSGGGFSRPLPKAQRVCKFYESGHCKKGAFCDYLHP